jgi:HSP20 family protein
MRDLMTMQDEINRMLGEFASAPEGEMRTPKVYPAADIAENKDSFVITAELPGLKKEDVKVTLQNNILTISGEKKMESEQKGQTYHRVERSFGTFFRTFELPIPVDSGKIQADFKDGILSISMPKVEEAKPREIAINVK